MIFLIIFVTSVFLDDFVSVLPVQWIIMIKELISHNKKVSSHNFLSSDFSLVYVFSLQPHKLDP